VTYLHPDHLGTPKFRTNAGGTQVWAWAPDAFGNGSPSGAATVTRYENLQTGKSVVVDDITREVLQVGGHGFNY